MATVVQGNATTTATAAFGSAPTSGNLFVLFYGARDADGTGVPVFTLPAGWTEIGVATPMEEHTFGIAWWTDTESLPSGNQTVSYDRATTSKWTGILEFNESGVSSWVLDKSSFNGSGSNNTGSISSGSTGTLSDSVGVAVVGGTSRTNNEGLSTDTGTSLDGTDTDFQVDAGAANFIAAWLSLSSTAALDATISQHPGNSRMGAGVVVFVPDSGGSPVNVDAAAAGLVSSAQPADIGLGALDTQASPSLMSMAAQAAAVNRAALGIDAVAADLGLSAQSATVALGALNVEAQPATTDVIARAAAVTRGSLDIQAQPATTDVVAQAASVGLSALDVQAQPAAVELLAQAASVDISGAEVEVLASPAVLTLTAQPAVVSRGELNVLASPAVLGLAARTAVVEQQPLDVEAVPAELQLSAVQADVRQGTEVLALPALLELDARGASVIIEGSGSVIDALPASFGFSARAASIKINNVEATGPSLGAPGLYEPVVAALEWRRGWHDKTKKKKKKRK